MLTALLSSFPEKTWTCYCHCHKDVHIQVWSRHKFFENTYRASVCTPHSTCMKECDNVFRGHLRLTCLFHHKMLDNKDKRSTPTQPTTKMYEILICIKKKFIFLLILRAYTNFYYKSTFDRDLWCGGGGGTASVPILLNLMCSFVVLALMILIYSL